MPKVLRMRCTGGDAGDSACAGEGSGKAVGKVSVKAVGKALVRAAERGARCRCNQGDNDRRDVIKKLVSGSGGRLR
jgi:hypothetical protein